MTETPRPSSVFAVNVFDQKTMRERLPRDVYEQLVATVEGGGPLSEAVANAVAMAMKEWAIHRGVTHYTHWFQPRTEMTAEKHMAFLSLDRKGYPLETFTGNELIQSEPDASSLPSGGIRSTFEARGYTAWDPTSPAFILEDSGGGTLCIPSVFISHDGTPLDLKTPLLRSLDALEPRALRLLKLFGNRTVKNVQVTVGAEQEFFLVDEEVARRRPDLLYCDKTVFGSLPPKAQQMEDHYFGSIHPRVLAYMAEVEEELTRLGVVIKTRHNEVAPCQFEFAPLHCEANLASDQNQVTMGVMRKLARKHGFRLLLHEKPFMGLNGSGKHTNFSLVDSEGRNLLEPSNNQRRNLQFLAFLTALLLGVSRFGGLLRASVASAGNMHRLGGNEAPPAIMSVYLGEVLSQLLEEIKEGSFSDMPDKSELNLGLNRLPSVKVDNTDRNRTSPIAFTGNKFEFRATGASQSISGPLTMIVALWSWGIEGMAEMIEKRTDGGWDITDAALDAVRQAYRESSMTCFDGNCYSPEWREEAGKRGLPLADSTPEALALYLVPEHRKLLDSLGIMSDREIVAYYETRLEQYCKTVDIEMGLFSAMIWEGILPALSQQIGQEAQALHHLPPSMERETQGWREELHRLVRLRQGIMEGTKRLESLRKSLIDLPLEEQGRHLTEEGMPLYEGLRAMCDEVEGLVSLSLWPYPTYRDIFSLA